MSSGGPRKGSDKAGSPLFELCRKKGIRLTSKRAVVVEAIESSDDHPNVESLWRRARRIDPKIAQATVYRTVGLLESAGILNRYRFASLRPSRYETSVGPHHDHLIDVDSGDIIEFQSREIEDLQRRVARKLGYELVGHYLELKGRKKSSKRP